MAQLKYIVGLTVILATLCSNPINAQDKSVAKSDKDIKQAVTEQMEAIGDLVAKGNYKAAAEQMTPAAQDSFALSQIMNAGMGIQMTKEIKEQLGPMAKHLGFGDTKELEQILEKHGLSDVGLTGQMEIQVIGREMSDEDEEEPKAAGKKMDDEKSTSKRADEESKEDDKNQKTESSEKKSTDKKTESESANKEDDDGNAEDAIMEILDKDGKRWDIVGEVSMANDTPLSSAMTPFGEIKEIELSKDKATAFVTIKPGLKKDKKEAGKGGGGGMQMQMQMQSSRQNIVVRLIDKDGVWMHDGVDEERTSELSQEMGRGGGFGDDFDDF